MYEYGVVRRTPYRFDLFGNLRISLQATSREIRESSLHSIPGRVPNEREEIKKSHSHPTSPKDPHHQIALSVSASS